MKEIVINKLINIIKKYNDIDNTKLLEIKYGLETIYLTIVKTIIFIVLAYFINTLTQLLYFILFYGILRLTGFGVHAHKSLHCWISSILIFVLIPILIKYVSIPEYLLYVVTLLTIILFCLYAPADTPKRPLINKKKRIIYKLLTIIIGIIYFITIIMNNNITTINSMFYSLVLESFLVTPIAYKIFGVSYKNYKNYKRKEKK